MMKWLDPMLGRRYLMWPLSLLLLTGLLGWLGGWFLSQQERHLQAEVQKAVTQLDRLVRQVEFLKRQAWLFHQYGDSYSQIYLEGLVQPQDRAAWTDALLKIQKDLVLKPFKIQFEPEKRLQKTDLKFMPLEKPIFFYTRLNLTAGLQSDRDIVTFIRRISKEMTPFFLIEGCEITQEGSMKAPSFNRQKGGLNLQCSLVFFKAKPRQFKGRTL